VRQNTKKYMIRNSPPFPANECKNRVMMGNDGKLYVSKVYNGIGRWVLF